MATFVDRARPLAAAAAQIARLKGAEPEATVLEQAKVSLVETGYDNWNGGTDLYTFMLEVPIPTYAAVEDDRESLEKAIHQRISQLVRKEIGSSITDVVISPILSDESRPVEQSTAETASPEDTPTFWQSGYFRLFISHISANKESAHRLKEALAKYQVAAFVAHDDIEPTKEWQAEIERALRTMDALVAIVAPGFIDSRWCDQEVGIAIGRGKLVISLCAGSDPHGFLSKQQGIQTKGLDASAVAERVVDVLIHNIASAQRMSEALVDRLITSVSWDQSKRMMSLLEKVPRLNASQVARLVRAIEENGEVANAFGVPERIRSLVSRVGES